MVHHVVDFILSGLFNVQLKMNVESRLEGTFVVKHVWFIHAFFQPGKCTTKDVFFQSSKCPGKKTFRCRDLNPDLSGESRVS